MQSIKTLIEELERNRKIHISILDLAGIMTTPLTEVDSKNAIHSKSFCNIAKATEAGYNACLKCKERANRKAISGRKPFSGYCVYGLYEAVMPVIINNTVQAIVYVGNSILDIEETKSRIEHTSDYTGANINDLFAELPECEVLSDRDELYKIADIISEYLKLLVSVTSGDVGESNLLVRSMRSYADERFRFNITMHELAIRFQKNEQYLGRLFKKHMGISFSEYYINLRLMRAEELLRFSKEKVVDIALECGFNSISYFNRAFRRKHGISPTEYRSTVK